MAKEKSTTDSWDTEANEVQSNWVKFNVPLEDKVLGTLVAKRSIKSTIPGKEGQLVNVYELKADMGHYHTLDDKKKVVQPAVEVESGSFLSIGGTATIDRQMTNIRVGQKVGFKFIEEVPSKTKGFAPAKIVKVYVPKNEYGTPQMDEEFLNQQQVDNFDK